MERTLLYLAIAGVLIGIVAAADVECYDCFWYSGTDGSDDNCNDEDALKKEKVDMQTCDGKCYTSTTHTAIGRFVGRGCSTDCQDGPTKLDKWVLGLDADRECCSGNRCNDKINAGNSAVVSFFTIAFCLASAFLYKLK